MAHPKVSVQISAKDAVSPAVRAMSAQLAKFSKIGSAAFMQVGTHITNFENKVKSLASGTVGHIVEAFSIWSVLQEAIGGIRGTIGMIDKYQESLIGLGDSLGFSESNMVKVNDAIMRTAELTKRGNTETINAYRAVAAANPVLKGNAEALTQVTEAGILFGKASRQDIGESSKSVAGILRKFNIDASQATRVVDALSASGSGSAAAAAQNAEALDKLSLAAKRHGLNYMQTLALIKSGRISGLSGEAEATGISKALNILDTLSGKISKSPALVQHLRAAGVDIAKATNRSLDPMVRLMELGKLDNVKYTNTFKEVFGNRDQMINALLKGANSYASVLDSLNKKGVAEKLAEQNESTLSESIKRLGSAWERLVTGSSAATGSISIFARIIRFLADNLPTVANVIFILAGAYALWNLSLRASNALMFIQRGHMLFIATNAARAALGLDSITAAQWLLNIAMDANPVGALILGFGALIGISYVLYKNVSAIRISFNALWKDVNDICHNMLQLFTGVGKQMQGLFTLDKKMWTEGYKQAENAQNTMIRMVNRGVRQGASDNYIHEMQEDRKAHPNDYKSTDVAKHTSQYNWYNNTAPYRDPLSINLNHNMPGTLAVTSSTSNIKITSTFDSIKQPNGH